MGNPNAMSAACMRELSASIFNTLALVFILLLLLRRKLSSRIVSKEIPGKLVDNEGCVVRFLGDKRTGNLEGDGVSCTVGTATGVLVVGRRVWGTKEGVPVGSSVGSEPMIIREVGRRVGSNMGESVGEAIGGVLLFKVCSGFKLGFSLVGREGDLETLTETMKSAVGTKSLRVGFIVLFNCVGFVVESIKDLTIDVGSSVDCCLLGVFVGDIVGFEVEIVEVEIPIELVLGDDVCLIVVSAEGRREDFTDGLDIDGFMVVGK